MGRAGRTHAGARGAARRDDGDGGENTTYDYLRANPVLLGPVEFFWPKFGSASLFIVMGFILVLAANWSGLQFH